MKTAKVFMTGRSQAVRLPKEFRFKTREVLISKKGNKVILTPKTKGWDDVFEIIDQLPDDFDIKLPKPDKNIKKLFEK